jgi:hypothetical protein
MATASSRRGILALEALAMTVVVTVGSAASIGAIRSVDGWSCELAGRRTLERRLS